MIRTLSAAAVLLALAAAPAHASVPEGLWSLSDGKAQVRISSCGASLCATLVGLRKPNDRQGRPKVDRHNPDPAKRARGMIGLSLLSSMTPQGAGWTGKFYNPDDGETYAGSLQPAPDGTLRLRGCVLGGLLCKTQVLKRLG